MVEPAVSSIERPPLAASTASLFSLGLSKGHLPGAVVGRVRELSAIREGLISAERGLTCTVIDGEPGIGKTRLLLAAEEAATARGFLVAGATADEEIRGPFLLARSIFGTRAIEDACRGTPGAESVARAVAALTDREPGLDSLPRDQLLVRAFDLAALALRDIAAVQPLAVLVDDLQWADEDSVRLLRYVVRTDAASPIFLMVAMHASETATISEAVTLLADVERMGLLQRLHIARFSQVESTQFLEQVLNGQVDAASGAIMHGQAEGVPFVLSEQARAYREAGLIQRVDGVWTLARNAERLMPSSVRTLIQRRAARLPPDTLAVLAEAAVLGRNFSLRDLRDVKQHLAEDLGGSTTLGALLAPAVTAGLLRQHPEGSAADFSFTHEGVREYAAGTLDPSRRRALHGAIVDMLMAGGEPAAGGLSLLAGHALAAGRPELCSRTAIEAGRAALQANAPEEVLRLVSLATPVATSAADRIDLLRLRDDALAVLRRPAQRLEGLSELSALAEASGDLHLELDVMLRRAAALRLSEDGETATIVARRVRERAAEVGDSAAELAACVELGQCLLNAEIGDATTQASSEADFDGAQEAYGRALALAEAADDKRLIAAASRELGVIVTGRIRQWFVDRIAADEHIPAMKALLAGVSMEELVADLPIAPDVAAAFAYFERALALYEELGDRKGVMSTVVAMAAASWAPGIHLSGSVQHIEEIRRLTARVKSFTKESERALADAQMLYGSHVYSRIRGFPDAALTKGVEAFNAARALGDRTIEFAAAGGIGLQHAELGAIEEAERWMSRAAAVATASPTPFRALQLELWRGMVRAEAGDVEGMRSRLGQAVAVANEQGRPAARCEALALFATHAARLGVERDDEALIADAERTANEAESLAATLPGHPPWRALAMGAQARVLLARGDMAEAAATGREALALLRSAYHEDFHFDALLPAARAVLASGAEEERAGVQDHLQLLAAMIAQRVLDDDVRVRWFGSRVGKELRELGGGDVGTLAAHPDSAGVLEDEERRLLQLVTEARSNAEIATTLGISEEAAAQQLARLFAKIGVSSRADATALALTGSLV